MKPRRKRKIKSFQDLEVEKAKLKVALRYDRQRLNERVGDLREGLQGKSLIVEGIKIIRTLIVPKAPAPKTPGEALVQTVVGMAGEAAAESAKPKTAQWIRFLMPFMTMFVTMLVKTYLSRTSTPVAPQGETEEPATEEPEPAATVPEKEADSPPKKAKAPRRKKPQSLPS